MQDPNTGELHALESFSDPKRIGKEHWPVFEVGERVRFRGWWWEITGILDGRLSVKPVSKASKDDVEILTKELNRLKGRP